MCFKYKSLYLIAGYYVPLSTLAEVREQVLHYIPVMARPLVLTKTEHPINWTPVYADITVSMFIGWLNITWSLKLTMCLHLVLTSRRYETLPH